MGIKLVIGTVLLLSAAVGMAEPPRRNTAPKAAAKVTAPGTTSPAPLKLHIGDVRKYMMPNEFQAMVNGPDPDKETVIVEGTRDAPPPLKSMQPVPGGLAAPFWAVANPASSWRIFLPDVNAPPPGRPDVVPKAEFRRGP